MLVPYCWASTEDLAAQKKEERYFLSSAVRKQACISWGSTGKESYYSGRCVELSFNSEKGQAG